ncbi:MAG: hypothetical protein R3255_04505 [Candidatus Lokiarchaeia archaeon]|nr:hypothetical protein [Candidatus Lokiarchaeia archaeon]
MKSISKKIGIIISIIGGIFTILVSFAFPTLFPELSSIGPNFVMILQIVTIIGGIITIIGGLLSLKSALISGILVILGGIVGGGNIISFVAGGLILRERKTSNIKVFDDKIIDIILNFLSNEEKGFTATALAHYCIELKGSNIGEKTIANYLDYLNKQGKIAMTLKGNEKFYYTY